MSAIDQATSRYMRGNEVFADAYNFLMYEGRRVISPDSLEELDTKEMSAPYGGSETSGKPLQRTRDVVKAVTAMTDKKTAYLILGVENQTDVDFTMPVRNLLYDALQYQKQVDDAAASHKESGDMRKMGSAEFKSRFTVKDRLMPVITLVIYFGPDEWNGPRSLHEMFIDQNETVLRFAQDYKLHIIEPAKLTEDDFMKFHSSLREILRLVKVSKDKVKIQELLDEDESFKHLGRTEIDVINACFKVGLTMEEGDETMDMSSGFAALKEDAKEEGLKEGREQGLKQGLKQGREQVIEECSRKLFAKGFSLENIADFLSLPLSEIEKLCAK